MINFRPRIAIPARLAESSSVTRYEAIVTARKLAELIWDAGGEPLTRACFKGTLRNQCSTGPI